MNISNIIKKHLGHVSYENAWEHMKTFTREREPETPDEIWYLQHPPVFTQGQSGKPEHVLNPGNIPIVQSDRGGQVTYHGQGQLVTYFLVDLKRLGMGIRPFVTLIEDTVIALLGSYNIEAHNRKDAPGVYVNGQKICSLGLRVSRSCTYHGLALNVDMDLEPFQRINPCGFKQLKIVQIKDFVPDITLERVEHDLNYFVNDAFDSIM